MPKYDLIEEEIKWCEANRNPDHQVYQDGFISGLRHALFIMKSRPTLLSAELAAEARAQLEEDLQEYWKDRIQGLYGG